MSGINKVIIIGRLGQDPEVRFMPSGDAVANLSLATSETWKDKQTGEQKEKTEWHRVAIFGKLAEIAGQYLKKGSKVYIEGKLQTRKWTNQEGNDQYTTEIVLDGFNSKMEMLDSKPQDGGQQQQQQGGFSNQGQQQQAPAQQGGFANQGQQQQGGFSNQGQQQQQQKAPAKFAAQQQQQAKQGGFANHGQQQTQQRQAPANQGQQQQGGFSNQGQQQQAPAQQGGFSNQGQQQQAPKVNPQEPNIDFDDDIPF